MVNVLERLAAVGALRVSINFDFLKVKRYLLLVSNQMYHALFELLVFTLTNVHKNVRGVAAGH